MKGKNFKFLGLYINNYKNNQNILVKARMLNKLRFKLSTIKLY